MSDVAFNKSHFQQELRASIADLLTGDDAVNRGQIEAILLYFSSANVDKYSQDDVLALLDDSQFERAMKLVLIFGALALTIEQVAVFNAALEVFPVEEIPAAKAAIVIEVLDHIRDNPAEETRAFFAQDQGSNQFIDRISQLRYILSGRFAETL